MNYSTARACWCVLLHVFLRVHVSPPLACGQAGIRKLRLPREPCVLRQGVRFDKVNLNEGDR